MNIEIVKKLKEKVYDQIIIGLDNSAKLKVKLETELNVLNENNLDIFRKLVDQYDNTEDFLTKLEIANKLIYASNRILNKLTISTEYINENISTENFENYSSFEIKEYINHLINQGEFKKLSTILPEILFEEHFRGFVSNIIIKNAELHKLIDSLEPSTKIDKFHKSIIEYRVDNSNEIFSISDEVDENIQKLITLEKQTEKLSNKSLLEINKKKKSVLKYNQIFLIYSPLQDDIISLFKNESDKSTEYKLTKYFQSDKIWRSLSHYFSQYLFLNILHYKKFDELLYILNNHPNNAAYDLINNSLSLNTIPESRRVELIISLSSSGNTKYFQQILTGYKDYLEKISTQKNAKNTILNKFEKSFKNFGISIFKEIRQLYKDENLKNNTTKLHSIRKVIEIIGDKEMLKKIKESESNKSEVEKTIAILNNKLNNRSQNTKIKKIISDQKDRVELENLLKDNGLNRFGIEKFISSLYSKTVAKQIGKATQKSLLVTTTENLKNIDNKGELDSVFIQKLLKKLDEDNDELMDHIFIECEVKQAPYFYLSYNFRKIKNYEIIGEKLANYLTTKISKDTSRINPYHIKVFGTKPNENLINAIVLNFNLSNTQTRGYNTLGSALIQVVYQYCRTHYHQKGVEFIDKYGGDWHKSGIKRSRFAQTPKPTFQNNTNKKKRGCIRYLFILLIIIYIIIRLITSSNDEPKTKPVNIEDIRIRITITPPALETYDWETPGESDRPANNQN